MAFEEMGVILRTTDGAIRRAAKATQTFVHRVPLASAGSKADRALGFAARAATGSVHPEHRMGRQADRPAVRLHWRGWAPRRHGGRVQPVRTRIDLMADGSLPPEAKPPPPAPFTDKWFKQRDAADREDDEAAARYYR
ncbi:hypothetical protein SNK04_014394 [Fusarium graminearum]